MIRIKSRLHQQAKSFLRRTSIPAPAAGCIEAATIFTSTNRFPSASLNFFFL